MTTQFHPHRLAFVADAVYPFNKGGKETRLYEVSRHLTRLGHDVHIYTMKWWDGQDTICIEDVWFHAICDYYPLYAGHRRSTKQALIFGLATLRLLTERFDVLDVDHMPLFPLFSARVVCALRRRPLHATWHEVWGRAYWRKYLGTAGLVGYLAERLAYRMPHLIIANSEQTAQRLVRATENVPITTIPLGVDFAKIDATAPSPHRSDVIYAGRLLSHKNVDVLIEAVAMLARHRPTISCLILGEGPERVRLEALALRLGVRANVTFMDFVPRHEQLFALMKSSKVFVLPSEREGFGAVVLEANACGLPVITARHSDNAARHLLVEGENGFLTAIDRDSLARAIALCLRAGSRLAPRRTIETRGIAADWASVAHRIGHIATGQASVDRSAA